LEPGGLRVHAGFADSGWDSGMEGSKMLMHMRASCDRERVKKRLPAQGRGQKTQKEKEA